MLVRRKITAIIVAAAVLIGVAGCYPSAAGAIDRLREFATSLEGVTGVDSLRDTPENMAFPFGGNALGTAGVRIDGEDWAEHLDEVAEAVRDWLETEQSDEKVTLSVAIIVPFGGIGVTNSADETAQRAALLIDLAGDTHLTSARIGYDLSGTVDTQNPTITVGRSDNSSLRQVVTDWQPRFAEVSGGGMVIEQTQTVASAPAEAASVDSIIGGERLYAGQTADTLETPVMQWAIAMDEAEVAGWRVSNPLDGDASATVAAPSVGEVDALEAFARGTAGVEQLQSLTIAAPGFIVISQDGPPSGVRTLATTLAESGDYGTVEVSQSALSVGEITPVLARQLVASTASLAPATLAFTTTIDGISLQVDGTDVVYLAEIVPGLLDLDPSATGDVALRLLDDGDLWAEWAGAYETTRVEALFAAAHDATVTRGAGIQVTMGEGKDQFRLAFDAAQSLDEADVWVGNTTKADDRHRAAIAAWNALSR